VGVLRPHGSHLAGENPRSVSLVGRFGGPGRDRTDDLFHAINEVYSNINNLGARTAILRDRKARNILANWHHEWYHVLFVLFESRNGPVISPTRPTKRSCRRPEAWLDAAGDPIGVQRNSGVTPTFGPR
jgi:hypothetical protein